MNSQSGIPLHKYTNIERTLSFVHDINMFELRKEKLFPYYVISIIYFNYQGLPYLGKLCICHGTRSLDSQYIMNMINLVTLNYMSLSYHYKSFHNFNDECHQRCISIKHLFYKTMMNYTHCTFFSVSHYFLSVNLHQTSFESQLDQILIARSKSVFMESKDFI